MPRFLYTAWFRDPATDPDDQDHEWPACMYVTADTLEAARNWGDVLAHRRPHRPPPLIFLHSTVEREHAEPAGVGHALPAIADGEDAADTMIGW